MFTKSKTIKLCIALALSFTLILSMATVSFAASDMDTYEMSNVTINLNRDSNTKASAVITADTFQPSVYIKGTITLLEYSNGSWVTAKGVPTTVQTRTEYNTSGFYFPHTWTIKPSTSYRLKVVIEDKTPSGNIYKDTTYSSSI